MAKGKYTNRKGMNLKPLAMLLAVILLIGGTIGGTLAWLTDDTEAVVNTFTVGDIDITLGETKDDFKMIPGVEIEKDPKVTVLAGSEACWVFVKVEESDNLNDFIDYTIDADWTAGNGTGEGKNGVPVGVYYREQTAIADAADGGQNAVYNVLACMENPADEGCDGCVKVKDTVTKEDMDNIKGGEADEPTLTFYAYAIQKAGFTDAAAAWAEVSK